MAAASLQRGYDSLLAGIQLAFATDFRGAQKAFDAGLSAYMGENAPPELRIECMHLRCRTMFHSAEASVLRALISESQDQLHAATESLKAAKLEARGMLMHVEGLLATKSNRRWNLFKILHSKKSPSTATGETTPAHSVCLRSICLDVSILVARAQLWKAVIQMRGGHYMSGAVGLRKAWKALQKLKKEFSDVVDSAVQRLDTIRSSPSNAGRVSSERWSDWAASELLFGCGAFLFFVSIVPSSFKWILNLIGFSSNRSLGVQYLRQSADLCGLSAPIVRLLLFWIESAFFERDETAEALYQSGVRDHQNAVLFHYLGGYLARRMGRITEAVRRFEAAKKGSTQLLPLQLMCIYECGWCAYLTCDFSRASKLLNEFYERFLSPSFRAYALYQLAISLHMTGNKTTARKCMERIPSIARKHFSFDEYASKYAKHYLTQPEGLTAVEESLLRAANFVEIKDVEKATKILDSLSPSLQSDVSVSPKDEAEVYTLFLRARCYRLSGMSSSDNSAMEEAQRLFGVVVDSAVLVRLRTHLVPYALTELGEMAMSADDQRLATAYFRRAKGFGNFDFDKPLRRRLLLNTDRMKGEA